MADFNFDTWVANLANIPDELLLDAQTAISRERRERPARVAKEQAKAEVVAELAESAPELVRPVVTLAQAKEDPSKVAEWEDPGTDLLKAYLPETVVKHSDRHWENTAGKLNTWEPGGEGVHANIWRDVTIEVLPPAPKVDDAGEVIEQGERGNPWPFTPGIQVAAGDYVTYNGQPYKVRQPHTLAAHWAPDVAPSLFQEA
ncbi:TPA: carbohydrate-binding protein [Corynebacterium striatum]